MFLGWWCRISHWCDCRCHSWVELFGDSLLWKFACCCLVPLKLVLRKETFRFFPAQGFLGSISEWHVVFNNRTHLLTFGVIHGQQQTVCFWSLLESPWWQLKSDCLVWIFVRWLSTHGGNIANSDKKSSIKLCMTTYIQNYVHYSYLFDKETTMWLFVAYSDFFCYFIQLPLLLFLSPFPLLKEPPFSCISY